MQYNTSYTNPQHFPGARGVAGGAAERLRQSIGCRSAPAARATYERALAIARAQLGEEAFVVAWAAGQALTGD